MIFFAILKIVDVVLRPFLREFGRGGAYPFMPVITVSTLVALPVATFLQGLRLVL